MKYLLQIVLFLFFSSPLLGKEYVRPESFGAMGDGVADDTKALQVALESGSPLQLEGTYLITRSLTIKNDVEGSEKILISKNDVSLYCKSNGISIKGLTFDYKQHAGKLMRLKGVSDITIEGCEFLNVGNFTTKQSIGVILISEGSSNICIKKCRFIRCYASSYSSSVGVWVNFSKPEDKCHHIYVDRCYFDDFQLGKDADAVKVLGQNEESFMYVTNCEFRRCNKRALKFQARECHSKNNVIYVTRPMYCAIDFQRGHGSSKNDKIIILYDGESIISPNAGLLYRALCIAQGDVKVLNFNVQALNYVDNAHQIAICLQSFRDYDDGTVKNVMFNKCSFDGQASLVTVSEAVQSISDIKIERTSFKSRKITKTITKIDSRCKTTIGKYLRM